MEPNVTALERAFELARSGQSCRIDDLRRQLQSEGYDIKIVFGRELLRQLREAMKAQRHDAAG